MNLAAKEIRSDLLRFTLIAVGIGLLLLSEVCVVALYRGIVQDSLRIIDTIGADLWVVQGQTVGPFSEDSNVPASYLNRIEATADVVQVRGFVLRQKRVPVGRKLVEASILGLDFPTDAGNWIPLVAGRRLAVGRGEAIADLSMGLGLNDALTLGSTRLRVVGLVKGLVDSSGNPVLVTTLNDANSITSFRPAPMIREERPHFGQGVREVSAFLVRLRPGADVELFRRSIKGGGDLSVLSRQEEDNVFLNGRLDRLRRQILIFSVIIFIVSAVVVSLILYMATVEKAHEIALLTLIGARDRVVMGLVLQQSALIGAIAYVFAMLACQAVFPIFPRAMVQTRGDFVFFAAFIGVICLLGTLLGIRHALSIRAQEVLA